LSNIPKTQEEERIYEVLINKYKNVVFICRNNSIIMILSLDTTSNIRMEAYTVIHKLKGRKFILSGDHEDSVKELGSKLDIHPDNCIGSVDSEAKKAKLRQIRQTGKVLMIGDGLNDILSLSEADFGISFNTNSHLNIVASDIVFLKQNLNLIFSVIKLSWYTNIFIWFNIMWAFSYNLCMLPIAGGVFHKIDMSPTFSSFSMLCSSLLIILTSNLLRFINITPNNLVECKDSQVEINKPNNKGYIELITN
jgi:Cu2+-exporting ATPase